MHHVESIWQHLELSTREHRFAILKCLYQAYPTPITTRQIEKQTGLKQPYELLKCLVVEEKITYEHFTKSYYWLTEGMYNFFSQMEKFLHLLPSIPNKHTFLILMFIFNYPSATKKQICHFLKRGGINDTHINVIKNAGLITEEDNEVYSITPLGNRFCTQLSQSAFHIPLTQKSSVNPQSQIKGEILYQEECAYASAIGKTISQTYRFPALLILEGLANSSSAIKLTSLTQFNGRKTGQNRKYVSNFVSLGLLNYKPEKSPYVHITEQGLHFLSQMQICFAKHNVDWYYLSLLTQKVYLQVLYLLQIIPEDQAYSTFVSDVVRGVPLGTNSSVLTEYLHILNKQGLIYISCQRNQKRFYQLTDLGDSFVKATCEFFG